MPGIAWEYFNIDAGPQSYALTGTSRGAASARATLSVSYPLSGRSASAAAARTSTPQVSYALSGRSSGLASARASTPAVSYALSGRAAGVAATRSASPAVDYPLSGVARGRSVVRGATGASDYAISGAARGRAEARSAAPAVSYALSGRANGKARSAAGLGVNYALTGRASGRAAVYITTSLVTEARVGFDTPTSQLVAGPSLQEFRVEVRKTAGTGIPTARIELWENGAFVAVVLTDTDVTEESTQVISVSWDAALLSDISGAGVECRVVGEPDAAGGTATVEIGAISWNAFTANPQFALVGRASSGSAGHATASLSFAVVGHSQARSSVRGALSVAYALAGNSRSAAAGRSVATASYPLVGRARGTASGRSSVTTISYVLTGRASGTSFARAMATPSGTFSLLGRSTGRSSARSNRLVISHALVGSLLAQGIPTGTLEVQRKLSGMIGLEGHYAATVEVQRKLAGSLYASATLSGVLEDVIVGVRLTGTLSATAIPQGKLEVSRRLQGVLRGNGTMVAELTVARLEALYPELILSMSGYTGTVDDLRDSPDDVTDDTWITVS